MYWSSILPEIVVSAWGTAVDVVYHCFNFASSFSNLSIDVADCVRSELVKGNFTGAVAYFTSESVKFFELLSFDEFKLKLAKEFSLILVGNTILVLIAWKVYGPRISSKFMRAGASRKVIEELRSSMSELKLPQEHDFKYK